jgi:hypothetical protein
VGLQIRFTNHCTAFLNDVIQPRRADAILGHSVSPQAAQDQPLGIDQELPVNDGFSQAFADGHNAAFSAFPGHIQYITLVLLDDVGKLYVGRFFSSQASSHHQADGQTAP